MIGILFSLAGNPSWASRGWMLKSLKELSWFQHAHLSLGSGRQLQSSFMSRLSHKHYLLLLCLRVRPTSGAKIVCLSVSSTPDYCERGGMKRQCWLTLNHFEIVALACQRKERRLQAPGVQERRASSWGGWTTLSGKAISRVCWNQLHIEVMQTHQRCSDSFFLSYPPRSHSPFFCTALKLKDGK